MTMILLTILYYAFLTWLCLGMTLAVVLAVVQERKIWLPRTLPSISVWGLLKVGVFNIVWCSGCLVGSILVILKYVLTLGQSDIAYDAHCGVERWVAQCCISWFIGPVEVHGQEHLPPPDMTPAPIYVCNHASQIDVGAVYFLFRRFKWIAKQSVIYLPGVGQIMALSDHVFIQRKGKNKASVSNLFDKSAAALRKGIPMFFFPQGTRWMADRLPFKDGAFSLAVSNAPATVVPLSLDIPPTAWNSSYPLAGKGTVITLTIHPPVQVAKGADKAEIKATCTKACYSAVPSILQAEISHEETTTKSR